MLFVYLSDCTLKFQVVHVASRISLPKKIMTMETARTVPNGGEKERSDSDLEEPNLDDCQQDNGGKRKRSPSEERREERRAANRRSAMESRQVGATF